jgi:hypothetical protein
MRYIQNENYLRTLDTFYKGVYSDQLSVSDKG